MGLLLAACGSHPPRQATPPTAPAAPQSSTLAAGAYRVDPAESEIRLLVYRAGPMARLGHNHVIVNREIVGAARIAPATASGDGGATSFSLTIPAAGFVVDDRTARDEEGADFSAEVSDDARSGTLRNLLSAELLDAARFAVITLESVSVAADRGVMTSTVSVNVAGHRSTWVVPFTVVSVAGRLNATGSVMLRQSTLGLTPFRVMLGALAVQDEFTVKFKLVAVRSQETGS